MWEKTIGQGTSSDATADDCNTKLASHCSERHAFLPVALLKAMLILRTNLAEQNPDCCLATKTGAHTNGSLKDREGLRLDQAS